MSIENAIEQVHDIVADTTLKTRAALKSIHPGLQFETTVIVHCIGEEDTCVSMATTVQDTPRLICSLIDAIEQLNSEETGTTRGTQH